MPRSRKQPYVVVFAILAVLALACAGPTDQSAGPLVGHWATAPENLSPSGWHQYHLTFGATGTFSVEVRSYGLYAGQGRGELSGYSRTEGHYQAEGTRLRFEPQRLVWWDRFYGAASPEHVQEPYLYGTLFDDATYIVQWNRLTIRYVSYPADAPVQTTMELTRVR